jgi:hypothetical protein
MLVYRKNPRTGFLETINTDRGYKPKGWSASKEAALKRK